MKKQLIILSVVTCFFVQFAQAQYFTLRVAGGYAGPGLLNTEGIMGPKIDSKTAADDGLVRMANTNDKDSTYKPIRGSFGKGMNFTIGFGYMINRYFGVDLGISYLQSSAINCTQVHQMYLPDPNVAGGFDSTGAYLNCKISAKAIGVSLSPSIVVAAAVPGWKVYPYARFGLSMPIWGKLTDHITIDIDSAFASKQGLVNYVSKDPYYLGKHTDITFETAGTVSLGINGALGVIYEPLPFLKVFAEVNGQYLNTRAKSAEITKWDADGVSKIADRGIYRTQFTFVDQLSNTSNNGNFNPNIDKTKPKEDIRPIGPFSNLGFNVGVTFCLSKKILGKDKDKSKEKKN
jgi:hypothetical protein